MAAATGSLDDRSSKSFPYPHEVFPKGGTTFFIGHSFFIPVAKKFDAMVKKIGCFENHGFQCEFSSGATGSPASLWKNRKDAVEKVLQAGNIDLLGMTCHSEANSRIEDYQRFIDLALQYNPSTSFFIGMPWPPRGPNIATEVYAQSVEKAASKFCEEVLKPLREANPKNHIFFLLYGSTASIMKRRFDNGDLPPIKAVVGNAATSIFSDSLGHGGHMLTNLSALAWLSFLYRLDLEDLQRACNSGGDGILIPEKPGENVDWTKIEIAAEHGELVTQIVREVLAFNDPMHQNLAASSADASTQSESNCIVL